MIPPLGEEGEIPPGRYRTTLEEVQSRFVDHAEFVGSVTRSDIWDGFRRYLVSWAIATEAVDAPGLLKWIWIGGSFTSSKLDPNDIDVTPIVDAETLETLRGQPGVGSIRDLFEQRNRVTARYRVEPMPVRWRAIASTYTEAEWGSVDRDYLERRGAMDDWWQRQRGLNWSGGPPVPEDAPPRRGYLEVEL